MARIAVETFIVVILFLATLIKDEHDEKKFRLVPTTQTEWKEGPPSLPPGAKTHLRLRGLNRGLSASIRCH